MGWNDARVLGDLNSTGAQHALALTIPAVISGDGGIGPIRKLRSTLNDLIEDRLSRHSVGPYDDGDAIAFVDVGIESDAAGEVDSRLLGHRKICPIQAVSALAYVIEGRDRLPRTIENLRQLDRFAILHTTRLHQVRQEVVGWRDLDRYPDDVDIQMIAAELDLPPVVGWEVWDESPRWPVPVHLEFAPVDRFHIILPFARTQASGVPRGRRHAERQQEWHERVNGFGAQVLSSPLGQPPSVAPKWLPTPRHHPSAEWDLLIVAGRPLDPEEISHGLLGGNE